MHTSHHVVPPAFVNEAVMTTFCLFLEISSKGFQAVAPPERRLPMRRMYPKPLEHNHSSVRKDNIQQLCELSTMG